MATVEAEAAALRERLRRGVLDHKRIRLAALCGLPAARMLQQAEPEFVGGLAEFVRIAAAWGRDVALRVALSSAREVLGAWEVRHPRDLRPARAIQAAEAWLRSPSANAAVAASETGNYPIPSHCGRWVDAARAARSVARCAGATTAEDAREHAVDACRAALTAADDPNRLIRVAKAEVAAWAVAP